MTLVESIGSGPVMHLGAQAGAGHYPATIVVLTVAAALISLLVTAAVIALVKRRSRSYLLIVLALTALLMQTAVGVLAYFHVLEIGSHHLLEHGLDVAIAVFIIAAVYFVRSNVGDESERSWR